MSFVMNVQMKILLWIMILFVSNVLLYIIFDDYRFFLQKIKRGEEVVYVQDLDISDDYVEFDKEEVITVGKSIYSDDEILNINDSKVFEKPPLPEPTTETVLWKTYIDILSRLESYEFEKQDTKFRLFGLTDEYPREYLEYYNELVTVYMFPGEKYNNMIDIFSVLSWELPITLNEVNNFWEKSFFINLDADFDDDMVRVIIMEKGVVFWLKIQKTEYNRIKWFLLEQGTGE